MLRVKLLGGLVVERDDGSVIDQLPRRALGVLAVLAAAGSRPVSRDKLVGYFWPEKDGDRARHRLSDVLSLLRNSLPDGAVLTSGDDLRLNPEVATTDVGRLESALEWGRFDQAVAAWSGPFLDGFFVSDAPAFEHWVDGERERVAGLYARALTSLAEEAEGRDAAGDAVPWLKRLASHRPYDSAVSLRLIRALEEAGDRAGALRHARVHATLLREELELDPPPEIAAVLEDGPAMAGGAETANVPADADALGTAREADDSSEPGPGPHAPADDAIPRRGGDRRVPPPALRRAAWPSAALVLVALGGWWIAVAGGDEVAHGSDVIAVVPFTTSGGGLEVLGEGMVDVLSSSLDEVGPIRTVSPRTVLQRWRRETGRSEAGLPTALAVGEEVGATSVLLGSVVAVGDRARIDARLHALDGELVARARVDGPADSLLPLADALGMALLRDIWRSDSPAPTARLNAITTGSFAALRSYLRGERFYRAAQWDSAAAAYETAVAHDSTFALALARLSEVGGWRRAQTGAASIVAWADAALRHADRLPAREQTLVRVRRMFHDGNVAVVDSMDAYVARYPDDVVGRYYAADMEYHANPVVGFDLASFFAAFDRAIELDPTFGPAYHHPLEMALRVGDRERFGRYLAGLARASPNDPRLPTFREAQRFRWAPPDVAVRQFLGEVRAGERALVAPMQAVLAEVTLGGVPPRPDASLAYLDSMTAVLASEPGASAREGLRIASLVGLGRLGEAADEIGRRGEELWLTNGSTPVMLGYAPPDFAARVLRVAEVREPAAAEVLHVLDALHRGDVAAARRRLASAPASTPGAPEVSDGLLRALEGWADVLAGDTVAGARAMRAGLREMGFGDLNARFSYPVRHQLALLDALRPETREAAIRGVALLRISPGNAATYAWGQHVAGRVLERAGRAAEAAEAYRRFAALFAGADAELQPLVAAARAAAARLGRGG